MRCDHNNFVRSGAYSSNCIVGEPEMNVDYKRPRAPTRKQKECLSGHYMNANDWFVCGETEFYLKIINRKNGKKKTIDKFSVITRKNY